MVTWHILFYLAHRIIADIVFDYLNFMLIKV